MKRLLLCISFIISSTLVFSQGEANIWYFGENAGLDFNNCVPFAITDGELNTIEGCSSFSDANGNLLFYSDGITVWNRNHEAMPNGSGLLGDPSSSQSAMIIPRPGHPDIYYIFTVDDVSGGGFHYYTIDMAADNGLGDVIAGPVDLTYGLFNDWSEKVAAVKGAEKGTFWVVSYVYPDFHAFKVTSDGVNETAVKSSASFNATDRRGYLKISPDGTKLAVAHQMEDGFLLYDFDDSTGKVSNQLNLPLITEGNEPYGVEFSPNSEKLYVLASNDAFNSLLDDPNEQEELEHFSTIFQFDVSLNNDNAIINSREIVHESDLFRGALQLGPDRRIYRTLARSYTEGIPQLGVINNPDADAKDCDYDHTGVGLLGNLSTQGLPPFIASIFSQVQIIGEDEQGSTQIVSGQTVNICAGDNFNIYAESFSGSPRYKWFYNGSSTPFSTDPIFRITDASTAINGDYRLEIDLYDLCGNLGVLEGEFTIDVYDPIDIIPFIELTNCDADGIADGFTDFNLNEIATYITDGNDQLTVTFFMSYAEADNKLNELDPFPFNNSTTSTIYARIENSVGCYSITTVDLAVSTTSFPSGYSGEQLTICDNDDTIDGLGVFDLSAIPQNILNQFPSGQNLEVSFYRSSDEAELELNAIDPNSPYMTQTPFSEVLYVRVENLDDGACVGIGPYIQLTVNERPDFEVIPEIIFCQNIDSFVGLEALNPNGNYTYTWKDENGTILSNNRTIAVTEAGNYFVTATSAIGCESFEKNILVIASDIASIDYDDITITDDSNNNTITINNDGNNLGIGDYEFTLDYAFGEYQDAPFFENVDIGIHTLYVRDKNSCGVVSIDLSVIGFPEFFTPNNDGWNDYWRVVGVTPSFYAASTVEIYDRYGKIISIIDPLKTGWDGIYNGELLPETDYWFKAELVDLEGNIRKRQGHFSLIRRLKE